jgi:RNA polymerase sigma factor (sigma-70 family)
MSDDTARALDSVWRDESAKIVATLARATGSFAEAEDLAQEAMAEALTTWPATGIPLKPGAWIVTVAKRRAVDGWRRQQRLGERYAALARELEGPQDPAALPWDPDRIDDDVLRLIFTACHPVLSRDGQIALTLRVVAGLTTEEIGRALLVPRATVQQRIVRAKKTLGLAHVPFEVPPQNEFAARLDSVLEVVYLLFNEGYAATSGPNWMRVDVAREALHLARMIARLLPREPEVFGLLSLLSFQASRFEARTDAAGEPILLPDQDRNHWDPELIRAGREALIRADTLGQNTSRGPYVLQAAIAEQHATAVTSDATDWDSIVVLYEALSRVRPSPVVDLNRAVAVAFATGPATALAIVDSLVDDGRLAGYAPLAAVRGDLLLRLGRLPEARAELTAAAELTQNLRERALLLAKAAKAEGDTDTDTDHPDPREERRQP